jgi:hypothetical protein
MMWPRKREVKRHRANDYILLAGAKEHFDVAGAQGCSRRVITLSVFLL